MVSRSDVAHLQSRLELTSAPVAITFVNAPPSDLPRIDRAAAAACGYWRLATEKSFYTTAADEDGCTVGAVTHGVPLSAEKSDELNSVVGTMLSLKYLHPDEVAGIPRRAEPFQYAIYQPLQDVAGVPDLVIVRGGPRQIMILAEAAMAAGAFSSVAPMGRPACAMIPQVLSDARSVLSLGCVGNRVYTGLPDGELYLALPGSKLTDIARELDTVLNANEALQQFHAARAVVGA